MIIIIRMAKLIVKLLIFIILLPFILIWLITKYVAYKYVLVNSLKEAGMPAEFAKELAREAGMSNVFKLNL